jgi:ATP-binding cassette subfamily B protein
MNWWAECLFIFGLVGFSTAMQADVIHVMAAGRIIESGTHAELLAMGGQYAWSWRAQMRETAGVNVI